MWNACISFKLQVAFSKFFFFFVCCACLLQETEVRGPFVYLFCKNQLKPKGQGGGLSFIPPFVSLFCKNQRRGDGNAHPLPPPDAEPKIRGKHNIWPPPHCYLHCRN